MPLGDLTPQKETKPVESKSIAIGGVPQTKTKITIQAKKILVVLVK